MILPPAKSQVGELGGTLQRKSRQSTRYFYWALPVILLLVLAATTLPTVSPLLQAPSLITVGDNPTGTAIADFNGDGEQDLAVTNYSSNDVSILLRLADGKYSAQTRLQAGSGPIAITVGDFNNDSFPDLAVANLASKDISILLGLGDGAFRSQLRFALEAYPETIFVTDFNRDARQDLATANPNSGDVSLLFGAGDGRFSQPTPITSGGPIYRAAAADFNSDGIQDLLMVNPSAHQISVLAGRGDGSFEPPISSTTQSRPAKIAVADINADGVPDVAMANAESFDVSLLTGRGDGTFGGEILLQIPGSPGHIVLTDLNNDERADLVVALPFNDQLSVFLSPQAGDFPSPASFLVRRNPQHIAYGDLNNDGFQDLAVASGDFSPAFTLSRDVTLFMGLGDGNFVVPTRFTAGSAPRSVTSADFNLDDIQDLATANRDSGDVSIFLGLGDGAFDPQIRFPVGVRPESVKAGDFNADGKPDLAVANNGDTLGVSILIGLGNGRFSTQQSFPSGDGPKDIAVGDFDSNGIQDLAVANSRSDDVSVLVGQGDGTFIHRARFVAGDGAGFLAIADFNRDGREDLAVSNLLADDISVLFGNGDGTFYPGSRVVGGRPTGALASGDFNQDGNPDIATAANFTMLILLGRGDGSFGLPARLGIRDLDQFLTIADFNLDGLQDLGVTGGTLSTEFVGPGPGLVSIAVGMGDGTFDPEASFVVGRIPLAVTAHDFNRDGSQDLAWVDGDELWVALNQGPPLNRPPTAVADAPARVECSSPAGALVTLDGSGSLDPDSTPGTNDSIVSFEWFADFGLASQRLLGIDEVSSASLPLGSYAITLRVTDSAGATDVDQIIISVVDTTPPAMSLTFTPSLLWPPNHRLMDVQALVAGGDACGPAVVSLESITGDEPDDAPGLGDGHTASDIQGAEQGTADLRFGLRAERDGRGDGRVYTVLYVAQDGSGNIANLQGVIAVPHDLGGLTEPLRLTARENGLGTVIEWGEVPGSPFYNVVRGEIRDMILTTSEIDLGPLRCIAAGLTSPTTEGFEDPERPPVGEAFFYLVEYSDGFRSGYGTESAPLDRRATNTQDNCP